MGQRLADITPYQQEVERHMALLSTQLLGVVSGEIGGGDRVSFMWMGGL